MFGIVRRSQEIIVALQTPIRNQFWAIILLYKNKGITPIENVRMCKRDYNIFNWFTDIFISNENERTEQIWRPFKF